MKEIHFPTTLDLAEPRDTVTLEEALGSVFNHAQPLYILQSSQCQRTPCFSVLQENSTSITLSDARMICKYLPHST